MGMSTENLFAKIRDILKGKKSIKIIIIIGFIGMGLILLSEWIPSGNEGQKNTAVTVEASEYCVEMERQLVKLLQNIDGVGKVSVMITVEGTEEYIYAEQKKENGTTTKESQNFQSENSYILIDKNSSKEALVEKIVNPKISGIVVVCEGGDNVRVKEGIYMAASVAFDVPSNRIYVAKLAT